MLYCLLHHHYKSTHDDRIKDQQRFSNSKLLTENKEVQKKKKEADLEEDMKEEGDRCSICFEDLPK